MSKSREVLELVIMRRKAQQLPSSSSPWNTGLGLVAKEGVGEKRKE